MAEAPSPLLRQGRGLRLPDRRATASSPPRSRVIVRGEAFVPSYTEGDNSMVVVATDSMKNFIHAMALEYEATSLEGFVELARQPLPRPLRPRGARPGLRARRCRSSACAGTSCAAATTTSPSPSSTLDRDGRRLGALRPGGSPPDQADGQLVRRLRPRRVHDAPRGRTTGRCSSTSTSDWRNPDLEPLRGRRGRPRLGRLDLLRPSTRPRSRSSSTRWACARWSASRSIAEIVFVRPRTGSGTPRRRRGGRARAGLHRPPAAVRRQIELTLER